VSLTLLIDSVHSELSVALVSDKEAVWKTFAEQKVHDKNLIRLIKELLAEQRKSFDDIDAYAAVVGPGSWTGCRVGVTAVKGFCFALPKPVFALNSLDALGDPAALRSNLDNYYIKRGDNYTYEKLDSTEGYATLSDINTYRHNLIEQLKNVKQISASELVPFYVADFKAGSKQEPRATKKS